MLVRKEQHNNLKFYGKTVPLSVKKIGLDARQHKLMPPPLGIKVKLHTLQTVFFFNAETGTFSLLIIRIKICSLHIPYIFLQGIKWVFLPCRKNDYVYIADVAKGSKRQKLKAKAEDIRILHPDFVRYVHKV